MIQSIDHGEAICVRGLRHVDARTVLAGVTSNWQRKSTALLTPVQTHQLRAVPDAFSAGMKTITYCKWFGLDQAAG
jgi:hypothetical protein